MVSSAVLGDVLRRARPELAQFDPDGMELTIAAMMRAYERVMLAEGVDPGVVRRVSEAVFKAA